MKIIAIFLISFGISILVYRGYQLKEQQSNPERNNKRNISERIVWPEYAGAFAMAIGVFILLGRNKLREK